MSERTGVGLVEVAVLEAIHGLGGQPDRGFRKSSRVLDAVETSIGLAPAYGYQVLVDLVQPWRMPVPLVSGQGNFGSPGNDPPAGARYTEVRLSRAGQFVVAAERGDVAPIPVGLINGNTYREGTRPPFRPHGIMDAIRLAVRRPRATNRELEEAVGPPDFMTGCAVTGDIEGLYAGRSTTLRLQARVRITDESAIRAEFNSGYRTTGPDRALIVIDRLPPYVNIDDTLAWIAERSHRPAPDALHPQFRMATWLELAAVRDESSGGRYRLVCVPNRDADPGQVREKLLDVYGVYAELEVALPKPLARMIREWTAAHRDEDILASLTELQRAIPQER